ncbi:cyclase family protein [Microvirga pakistanensis]|uniref:cyclase family protein n=1 Tax=Microvirga pakistanensis TaxID=1682650 RepID=UPI00106A69EC|nr:cyclase family protein [Microvirga pakistanensis]
MTARTSFELWSVLNELQQCRWIDLTHAFDRTIPHCGSFDAEERITLYHYDEGVGVKGHGFLAHEYRHAGQWGTHVDPPAHFIRGLRHLDELSIHEMILPLVVIDITQRVEDNPDYCIALEDVKASESRNGPVPQGAFVAKRTGWSSRWPDAAAMKNCCPDGISHFPGWSLEVLQYLAEHRNASAIGHETTDTDPGVAVSRHEAPLEAYWLAQDKWQIELLSDLTDLPEAGAILIASWPKPRRGSGFPARVFAIAPVQ